MKAKAIDFFTRSRYWLPLVLWMGLIIGAATIPITYLHVKVGNDKFWHFLEFFILALLAFRAFFNARQPLFKRAFFAISIVFCFLFGILTEVNQSFIPGRVADLKDFVFNMIGVAAAAPIFIFLIRRKKAD